jgi:hypothetical protein
MAGELLGIDPGRVDELPPLAVSELIYRLGEDDQPREAVLTQAVSGVSGPAPALDARALPDRTASLSLRSTMPD